jgi:2-keto-4-pentenoate hydratase/2-oxohepta-3-ene-1,7-dioic acid hydratase in catechol pathway
MKYVTFSREQGASAPGYLDGERVVSLRESGFPDLLSVIASGGAAGAEGPSYPLSEVRLLAPIPRPPKIICVGLNWADHAREAKLEIPKVPTIFAKFPTAAIGPGDAIVLPKASRKPDYEAEFAFIVGRGGRHIPAARWREHVFGYTNFNDVSARDVQTATSQWIMGKTFDTFAPFGPWIVSADEIEDPHSLDITLSINGEVLQCSNTRELIFKIPDLIEFLSSVFTLEPGDIVSTGTPAGVGFARRPPRYLRVGDDVVVSVQGLGQLRNPVIAED